MRELFQLLKQTYTEWSQDRASRLAAALAYYAVFSLAPLLLIIIAVAGFVWGQGNIRAQMIGQAQNLLGESGAKLIQSLLDSTSRSGSGLLASLIGVATLILGAVGVFNELQSSLNHIWKIEPGQTEGIPAVIKNTLIDRLASFGLILGIGGLLLFSLITSTIITGLPISNLVLQVIDFFLSFGLMTLLFAMIYKFLPDAEIAWQDVWMGAAVTALLFTIGKYLVSIYLNHSATSSAFGAAGSLALLLIWIYYTAQIVFFGAEFTQVYANRIGSKILPDEDMTLKASEDSHPATSARPEPALESRYLRRKKVSQPIHETSGKPFTQPGLIILGVILASFIAGRLLNSTRGTTKPDCNLDTGKS